MEHLTRNKNDMMKSDGVNYYEKDLKKEENE